MSISWHTTAEVYVDLLDAVDDLDDDELQQLADAVANKMSDRGIAHQGVPSKSWLASEVFERTQRGDSEGALNVAVEWACARLGRVDPRPAPRRAA